MYSFQNIFANLFIVWLNRRCLESLTCFCIQSIVIQCWNIRRKSVLIQTCSWERKKHFNAFLDNCQYSSMMLHQNLLSNSFLKVSCNAELETISMNFLYLVEFNSVGVSCTFSASFIHEWVCNIMHYSLFHWMIQIFL